MKTIIYRGGVVSFKIPISWVEEYEDDSGGAFYEDVPDSGTLRLNIITMKSAKESAAANIRRTPRDDFNTTTR